MMFKVGCDRNRMANLSKASNVVQEKYILYDVTGFTQKWHSIPVATNCTVFERAKRKYEESTRHKSSERLPPTASDV